MDVEVILEEIARETDTTVDEVRNSDIKDIFFQPDPEYEGLSETLYFLDQLCRRVLPGLGSNYEFIYQLEKSLTGNPTIGCRRGLDSLEPGTFIIRLKMDSNTGDLTYTFARHRVEHSYGLADIKEQIGNPEDLDGLGFHLQHNSSTPSKHDAMGTSCTWGGYKYVHVPIVPTNKISTTLEHIKEAHDIIEKYFVKKKAAK